MNQDRFVARHEEEWQRLAAVLRDRGAPPEDVAALPALYRRVCHHYALARARHYSSGVVERLHGLVLEGHQRFYGARRPFWRPLGDFLTRGYPRLVRREWPFVLASALCFLGPLLMLLVALQFRPELVYTVMDGEEVRRMEAMYRPGEHRRVGRARGADSDVMMFGFYLRNNTGIGFRTFAGGLPAGLGTLFFLALNGIHIGAVAGHLTAIGYIHTFWGFVAGHSAFELTAIVLSGAAGLRLGWALVAPGPRTRLGALREDAVVGVRLIYGAALLFLAAAFVEAFWSSLAAPAPAVKYGVGVALWLLLMAYLVLAGRGHAPR